MGKRNIITFELRKGKDDDIEKALAVAVNDDVTNSDVIRAALRSYLGGVPVTHTRTPFPMHNSDVVLETIQKGDDELEAALNGLWSY